MIEILQNASTHPAPLLPRELDGVYSAGIVFPLYKPFNASKHYRNTICARSTETKIKQNSHVLPVSSGAISVPARPNDAILQAKSAILNRYSIQCLLLRHVPVRLRTYPVTLSLSTVLRRVTPVLGHIVIHCKGAQFKSVNFWYLSVKKWYISVNFNMDYKWVSESTHLQFSQS